MRNAWTIARREYNLYFISPIAYAVAFILMLIIGIIFYANVVPASFQQYPLGMDVVFGPMTTLYLFTVPAITMRTLAEEQRSGTLELLLTAPVNDWELVAGKWLGAFLYLVTVLSLTAIFPVILSQIIEPGIDLGAMAAGYIGLILLAASFTAIGVLASSLFNNQIAAFFTALGILLVMWMIGFAAQSTTGNGGTIISYLDMSEHFYNSFIQGVIELKDVVYFVSVTVLALVLGGVSLETRRWR